MDRRRFTFWLGFGLFSLSEKFCVSSLDTLAAAAMRRTESANALAKRSGAEHWTLGGDKLWHWFERENLVKGEWVLTGRTTPVNKETGERKPENFAYIDDSLVPAYIRASVEEGVDLVGHEAIGLDDKLAALNASHKQKVVHAHYDKHEHKLDLDPQLPSAKARARHGRPPSKWLRSLHADEIRVWLKTVELPEAGVSGMTVWTHLTRDHKFQPARIKGLTDPEMVQLHAAAHYGY
jgi:hypothetical protein